MPVNATSQRGTSASEVVLFSAEQLGAMNKVLVALLSAVSVEELLASTHTAMRDVAHMSACAHYVPAEHGHLRLDCGVGMLSESLPDVIPKGTDLFASIQSSEHIMSVDATPLQGSLFGDTSVVSFWAVTGNGRLVGAFACVHAAESEEFVNAVCRQIAVSLDRFCGQSDSVAVERTAPEETPETHRVSSVVDVLTNREQEVLALVSAGLRNKEIAAKLFISLATCKHHLENVYAKLGVHNRSSAAAAGLGSARFPPQSPQVK